MMTTTLRAVQEYTSMTAETFRQELLPAYQPAVIRQYVRDWPAVNKQRDSLSALVDYLRSFDAGKDVVTYRGAPEIAGKFFYQEDLGDVNFERIPEPFARSLASIVAQLEAPDPQSVYMGAVSLADNLPGFAREHRCDLAGNTAVARIWLGSAATVSTHYDMLDNVVCVVAGRRRFTLFPPEQLVNLYVGPIDFTLSGQPVSMVSLENPDFERFPRFREALAAAQVVELEPGDALYIPKLWWHHVQSLAPFNGIVNYWWNQTALADESPYATLMHGLLTLSHLPEPERKAWQAFFNHYVFRTEGDPVAHIPEHRRGILGALTPGLYQALKRQVLGLINR